MSGSGAIVGFDALLGRIDFQIFGDHHRLDLRWTDDQLAPIVQKLSPLLCQDWNGTPRERDRRLLACASICRSVVVDALQGGNGLRFPRGKDPYSVPARYRNGDNLWTHTLVTKSMDDLRDCELVVQHLGTFMSGRQSVVEATSRLIDLIGPLVAADEPRGIPLRVEPIVLRGNDGQSQRGDDIKKYLDYEDTPVTIAMREQMVSINTGLGSLDLRHPDGKLFAIGFMCRWRVPRE